MLKTRLFTVPALLLITVLFGCSSTDENEVFDPEAAFMDMEEHLLDADAVYMECNIVSEGTCVSSLDGKVYVDEDHQVKLKYTGTFDGKEVELKLFSDGDMMQGSCNETAFELETPDELHEGILYGFTRMGLLHNLAKLAGGMPPDATDGTVEEWVQAFDFWDGGGESVAFTIKVSGEAVGEGKITLHPSGKLPMKREQTVRFETGEMKVMETYTVIKTDDDITEKETPSNFR